MFLRDVLSLAYIFLKYKSVHGFFDSLSDLFLVELAVCRYVQQQTVDAIVEVPRHFFGVKNKDK